MKKNNPNRYPNKTQGQLNFLRIRKKVDHDRRTTTGVEALNLKVMSVFYSKEFLAFCRLQIENTLRNVKTKGFKWKNKVREEKIDHDGSRTRNLPIRSRTPYPLGHAATTLYETQF